MTRPAVLLLPLLILGIAPLPAQTRLPGTSELPPASGAERSAAMVAGIDRFALELIAQSAKNRRPDRAKLKTILGVVDDRRPIPGLEWVGEPGAGPLFEDDRFRVSRVRWPVFDAVHGEGLHVQPRSKPRARVILLPDADGTPEKLLDDLMVSADCEIVIPALVSRGTEWSGSARFGVKTNVSHREWIYRQAFGLGRHIIGYEIETVLNLVDWFKSQPDQVPVLVAGAGEGGMIALCAAAIDERIDSAFVAGYFGPRERAWEEPIYRNVSGLLANFGDAEIASLIAPRPLAIQHLFYPVVRGPAEAATGARAIAAPGRLSAPGLDACRAEVERARKLAPAGRILFCVPETPNEEVIRHLFDRATADELAKTLKPSHTTLAAQIDRTRQERLVRGWEAFTQRRIVQCEQERTERFWKPLPLASPEAYAAHTETQRRHFWEDVIGKLPDPSAPMNARSRVLNENESFTVHEVMLDVWPGVVAWGQLLVPNRLQPGEKRPVVVCQHGLEGLPEDVVTEDEKDRAFAYYKGFASRLAREGFITFAPHNFYRGKDDFRVVQRKLNLTGHTLFSVIIGQHQRILEFLKAQPNVDPRRIAFYGLSYGGKSAMRIPAALPDYCLSICSGDFNEWIRKCASIDLPMSYVFTGEYEIWEPNLGPTFNYAEMAALIAPRPFMVERGHNDGVGTDEWVSYEYAKVRRLYDKLGIGDRAAIEYFEGPHTIHGKGTFEFLHKWLDWPAKK